MHAPAAAATAGAGVEVKLGADGLGLIFALVASFLWILATAYNIGYMRSLKEHAQTRYYFCFAVAIFGAGPVGLMLGQLARRFGFSRVIGIEPDAGRRADALSFARLR